MITSPFDRNGLAPRQDLETKEWSSLFTELEQAQSWFSTKFDSLRSPEYGWKSKPLYDFSRCWEYPYVYHNLTRFFPNSSGIRTVDHGCAVTFFPFYLMRKGFSVTGVDIDPVVEKDFSRAVIEIPEIKDKGEFKKVLNNTLPFPDSSVDVIYSISVLEHIPSPHKVIAEIARILKSNGVFILTMDIDLVGNLDLSPQKYSAIMSEINKYFRILGAETTVHPKGLLTTKNSKYPFVIHQSLAVKIARPIWELVKPLLGRPKAVFPTLAVCGYVLERR